MRSLRKVTLLTSTLIAVASMLPSLGAGRDCDGSSVPLVSAAAQRNPLVLALKRARLFVLLVAPRSPTPAQASVDAVEHQRSWREHTRAAERFHAIVLESRTQSEDKAGGARQSD